MTGYIKPMLASAVVLAVLVAAFAAWSPSSMEPETQQIDAYDGESPEIVPISDDERTGTTFRAIPPVGTEAHDEWIEWYRTAEYEERNALTRDIAILFHDFEVEFNPNHGPDVSGKVVALMIQVDKLSGDYDPTVNERLMHDWHIAEHDPPADPDEIRAALLDIIGTADNIHYAEALYDAVNTGANFGYVPTGLHMQDREYWHKESMFASCEHFWDDCDADDMRASVAANRDLTDEEIREFREHMEQDGGLSVDTVPVAFDAVVEYEGIIPVAWAATTLPKYNTAYMSVWADTCTHYEQTHCVFTDHGDGIGWNSVFPSSTDWHDVYGGSSHTSDNIHYEAAVSASVSNYALSQYVYITGQFRVPNDSMSMDKYGTTYAYTSDSWDPPGNNHGYGAKARTYASVTYN